MKSIVEQIAVEPVSCPATVSVDESTTESFHFNVEAYNGSVTSDNRESMLAVGITI